MGIENFMQGKISPMLEKKKDPFTGKTEEAIADIAKDQADMATDVLNKEIERQRAFDRRLASSSEGPGFRDSILATPEGQQQMNDYLSYKTRIRMGIGTVADEARRIDEEKWRELNQDQLPS